MRATLRDGRRAERLVLLTRGDARNPLSDAEVDEKFLLAVSAGGWSPEAARHLLATLRAPSPASTPRSAPRWTRSASRRTHPEQPRAQPRDQPPEQPAGEQP